jgi:hypothetical protein
MYKPGPRHQDLLFVRRVLSFLSIELERQFKSSLRNQRFFSFNHFPKACNHPNVSGRRGDSRKLPVDSLSLPHARA